MNLVVIGGGITGHLMKLRAPQSTVLDSRDKPTPMTRQFGGNYLWEPLKNVQCRSFTVFTTVDGGTPDPSNVRAYKEKIGKGMDENWRDQFRPEVTGHEIVEWPYVLDIVYGCQVRYIDMTDQRVYMSSGGDNESTHYDVLVSTIPLPTLLDMTGINYTPFKFVPIHVTTSRIPPDVPRRNGNWYVNYISDPDIPAYRTTDRDGARHYESLEASGIPTKKIFPGKIWRHDRTNHYLQQLKDQNIYCFGRYARWEPEELVHETDKDIIKWVTDMGLSS